MVEESHAHEKKTFLCHGCVTPFALLLCSKSYTPVCFVRARHGSFCFPPPFITVPPTNVLRSSAPINTISFSLDVSVGSMLFSATLASRLATQGGSTPGHQAPGHQAQHHKMAGGGTHTPSTHTPHAHAPHGPAPLSPAHLAPRPRPRALIGSFERSSRRGAGRGGGAVRGAAEAAGGSR